jgi:hypothetical protein
VLVVMMMGSYFLMLNVEKTTGRISSFADEEVEFEELLRSNPSLLYEIYQRSGKQKVPVPRNREEKPNLWESSFGILLNAPEIEDPSSKYGRLFRTRYRLPYILFRHLVSVCGKDQRNIFRTSNNSYIPIEFKIMVALKILGKGLDLESASEESRIPLATCYSIFKSFCHGFVDEFYDEFVFFPQGEQIQKVNDTYSKVGFPGACGSMDVTHLRWDACPKDMTNFYKGRYPYPTVATQAIVDHNRRILYLSELFHGKENDKTITVNDPFCVSVIHGKLSQVEYCLYNEHGQRTRAHGGYFIVDGGYQNIACFVDPLSDAITLSEIKWSEYLTSVRKDVECTFGILKARFRILKYPLRYENLTMLTNIVKCCAILHNMLLEYDGLLTYEWEKNPDWEIENPDVNEDDILNYEPAALEDNDLHDGDDDETPILPGTTYCPSSELAWNDIHRDLIIHFNQQRLKGLLQWPKRFSSRKRRLFNDE